MFLFRAKLLKFQFPQLLNNFKSLQSNKPYWNFEDIIDKVKLILSKKINIKHNLKKNISSDQPNKNFMGPF